MIQFFNKKMNKKRKGFTLIELVVVIAILGLLVALAIPRFGNVRENAEQTTTEADARSIYSAVMMYYAETGEYPGADGDISTDYIDLTSLGGDLTWSAWSETGGISYEKGDITITISENGVYQAE